MRIKKRNLNRLIENYLFEEKYPYAKDEESANKFRAWVREERPDIASKYDISKTGDSSFSGLENAYEKSNAGKDFEQDQSYFGIGSYFSDYESEDVKGGAAQKEKPVQKSSNIQYHEDIPGKYKLVDPSSVLKGKNTFVAQCSETGCAEWVGSIAGWQGNAWHEHWHAEVVDSAFFGSSIKGNINTITSLFNKINRKPVEGAFNETVKSLVSKMIPSKSKFKNVELGSVVGLYWPSSSKFTRAFYEGATGSRKLGEKFDSGDPAGEPGFFETTDGQPWSPSMVGDKNIKFRPTDKLKSGKGFGMNTHLGFIGAYANGEPVVFHNIGPSGGTRKGMVYATPFKSLSKSRMMILWHKKPEAGYFDWLF
jgi:hypothetical protein